MNLKAVILKYKAVTPNNVTRRLLNSILKHEGVDKELVQANTLALLEELATSVEAIMDKYGLSERDAANILNTLAHAVLNEGQK